ncbi:hypothetical protein T4B_4312 [Trichinella pseudospiralis]|uniref:Uncharacterized protein n=1 Tax=Trichinella pseudospiralis TaxID=6337 RepID=A0A0V1I2T7_TRIPS|nr:hypothetical protein T4B_4312 [Trichinella pseudospiralis]
MAASNSRWKYSNKASTGPDVPTFKISKPAAKPADLPKHSLAKVEETTLHPDVGKVALNCFH